MQLSPHFSLEEFCRSDTAVRYGIDNDLPLHLLPAAKETCAMMERIRAHLSALAGRDIPLLPSSGYRALKLNRMLKSRDSSEHVQAGAMDFRAPAFGTPLQVARVLAGKVNELGIGQLINEYPPTGWVHVGRRHPDKMIDRIITISASGTVPGIVG